MHEQLLEIAAGEAERLRAHLADLNPLLARLVDAAAIAHTRRITADNNWMREGGRPDSPWLKVSRDALRDYLVAVRLLVKHSEPAADPLELPI